MGCEPLGSSPSSPIPARREAPFSLSGGTRKGAVKLRLRFFGKQAIRIHDEAPAGVRTFSQPELRAPSHAAGIKGSEELLNERPEFVKFLNPFHAPDRRVEGTTSEALARQGAREFSSSTKEAIPEQFTVAQILERNRNIWAQGAVAPAVANVTEYDLLRAANTANRNFWGAR